MKTSSKLMAAVAMLVISAIMMTTASFAWFTISTAPEVKTMTSGVVVNNNLEIALAAKLDEGLPALPTEPGKNLDADNENAVLPDTGNYYTWGNLIDMTDTPAADAIGAILLRPLALGTDDAGVYTLTAPTYGADGRINDIDGVTITDAEGYGYGALQGDDNNNYGYYVDFWIRTNMNGYSLGLTAAEKPHSGAAEASGCGSVITCRNQLVEDKIKVAFKVLASKANTEDAELVEVEDPEMTVSENTNGVLSNNALLTMTANTAYLVRAYVFLDGAELTNANAALTDLTADVTLQFALYDGNTKVGMTSMAMSTVTPAP